MESDNNKKSLVETYLAENKKEAKINIELKPQADIGLGILGKRFVASLVDSGILYMFGIFIIGFFLKSKERFGTTLLLNLLTEFLYAGYFYSIHSATPGKMLLKLKVYTKKGQNVDFLEAGLRDSIGKLLSLIILGIGYLMVFFRKDRRALHDLMFNTKVVEKN